MTVARDFFRAEPSTGNRRTNGQAIVLTVICFLLSPLLAIACDQESNSAQEPPTGELVVSGEQLELLTSYRFKSQATIESSQGSVAIEFDALYEAPDRYLGSLTTSADFLGLPRRATVTAISDDVWVRLPDEDWEKVEREQAGPYLLLTTLGSPAFYMGQGFMPVPDIESVRIPSDLEVVEVNGFDTVRVSLDKDPLLETLGQGTVLPFPKVLENAEATIPDDFQLEAWLAVDGGYPVRMMISLSTLDDDDLSLGSLPFEVQFQTDVLEVDVGTPVLPPE